MYLLGFVDVFTTKTCLTRVRAVPRYSLTMDNLEALNTICPTIGIMPSSLSWGVRSFDEKYASLGFSLLVGPRSKGSTNGWIHGNQIELKEKLLSPKMLHHYFCSVPYSDHSCFSKLQDFVKLICPSKISGIASSVLIILSHQPTDLSGDSQQPGWSWKKFRRSEPSESAEIMPTSVLGCSEFNESKRH
ncbi:5' exonuclease Apollo [Cinnamomum micranthum f. kanehirae]|uniref:5' exonuclease Apollo n=1 Tax=Cinnamomum micranthum f. kanehirae TaxID=337451 RepID=A0A443PJI4_9MAGN|nr:5' exonuclease Apollo [Cinnamomum micranthum f. kanehirae]